MGQTLDLGRRIELVSMDRHFHDITIGLYEQTRGDGHAFLVHTYSQRPGTTERVAFLKRAMQVLGGLTLTSDGLLRFPCGVPHPLGVRRVFLEAWKLPSDAELRVPTLSLHDKKCGAMLTARYSDEGVYEIIADRDDEETHRRMLVYTRGLLKLAGLDEVPDSAHAFRVPCKQSHDPLIGLLMVRAGDVRTAMREAAMMAARGVLIAPNSQPTDQPAT